MRFDKDEICRENVVFTKDVHKIGNVTVKNIFNGVVLDLAVVVISLER